MQVELTKKFLKYEVGHTFDVIREEKKAYVCKSTVTGKRAVIPKSKSVKQGEAPVVDKTDDDETIVYLTPQQKPVVKWFQEHTGKVTDSDIDDLVEDYLDANPGMADKEAEEDVRLLHAYVKDPEAIFKDESERPAGTVSSPVTGTMSAEETSILQDLLEGKEPTLKGKATLSVTSDTPDSTVEEPKALLPDPHDGLEPNQILFTDITNGRLPLSEINHIIDIYDDEHWDEIHRANIPKVDPNHYWDTEVLEAMVIAHKLNEKMLITGLPGTGKSTSVEQFAAWIKQPYLRFGGRGDLESADIIGMGFLLPDEKTGKSATVWRDGRLAFGVRNNYLVTIDEVMKIPSYIQMAMQHLYEKGGYLALEGHPSEDQAEKILNPGKEFKLFLTDNVKGTGDSFDKFAATQIQDTSTLDRICINVTLDYMQVNDEVNMLKDQFKKQKKAQIRKLVKFANLVRRAYKQGELALTLSPRGLLTILQIKENIGVGWHKAIELSFLNKIADESEAQAIKKMLDTVKLQDEK